MAMATEEPRKLEFFFIPFISPGHMIPTVDIARLFASHGVKSTIITTPYNALLFQNTIKHDTDSGKPINIQLIKFPREEVGLPEGIENMNNSITIPQMGQLLHALFLLQQPMESLIRQYRPDCIVSDMLYPWTADIAIELCIPRIILHPTSFFSFCAETSLERYGTHHNLLTDTDTFVIPELPHQIKMKKSELAVKVEGPFNDLMKRVTESFPKSFGVLVHSFYELESDYVEHYKKNVKDKVWHIGPVGLFNKDSTEIKVQRGSKASINGHFCLNWLDSQEPNSVIYICFGSMSLFPNTQLFEIASSLEASNHPFIWVVRKAENRLTGVEEEEEEDWLPEGFEKRMNNNNKGMIIRGWAPQLLILEHPAIGGFMTHTGWNSTMESVTAGVPLITWPLFADQFFNEKLVTEVLKIGVAVGVEGPNSISADEKIVVKREKIERAMAKLMDGGEEGEIIRKRVRDLSVAAKQAVKEGGSSYNSLKALILEISSVKAM